MGRLDEPEGASRKWMLLQKDEAQQEGSRLRSFYHVTRTKEEE